MSASPLGHLPARLHSSYEFLDLQASLANIEGRILRLRVQAFVLLIRELFDNLPQLEQLTLLDDGLDATGFASFEADEAEEEDLSEATDVALNIHLSPAAFGCFAEQAPFTRHDLERQLRGAYDQALEDSQRVGGGAWEPFWTGVTPNTVMG
jgi:hypothetical protein